MLPVAMNIEFELIDLKYKDVRISVIQCTYVMMDSKHQ